jgi:hypothetical protein
MPLDTNGRAERRADDLAFDSPPKLLNYTCLSILHADWIFVSLSRISTAHRSFLCAITGSNRWTYADAAALFGHSPLRGCSPWSKETN